jgi:hypothetical protein
MKTRRAHRGRKTRRSKTGRKQKTLKSQRKRHTRRCSYYAKGGSVLNAPNGSVVIVRDKGDKYSPFIAIDKQEAEREDF